jgi:short-chain fatty acids transporter
MVKFAGMFNRFLSAYARAFERWMPSPFAIAIGLTVVAALLALRQASPVEALGAWTTGLWNPGLIRFGFQAMFMLVLGHVLALAPPVLRTLGRATRWIVVRPATAAPKLAGLAMLLGWLNWGLGLIGGAILARGVLDHVRQQGLALNRGLLGAAGYMGMLVWHGGLSGSAPLKVAESGHLASLLPDAPWAADLPEAIGLRETVFSAQSLGLTLAVATVVLLAFRFLPHANQETQSPPKPQPAQAPSSPRFSVLPVAAGIACWAGAIWWAQQGAPVSELKFITPDWINMVLLGSALIAHRSIDGLLAALDEAIQGAAGILIQFPLYFGIMGIVTGTGLGTQLAESLVASTRPEFLPLALFGSSGLLNIFVPSGGGQWAVQGPLIIESCRSLDVPLPQGIMAMAFGDQLTNLLQPFWALPLLGITGLTAREILPYTVLVMLLAGAVMSAGLFWFA